MILETCFCKPFSCQIHIVLHNSQLHNSVVVNTAYTVCFSISKKLSENSSLQQLHFFMLQTKPIFLLLCNFINSIKQISGFVVEIIWSYTKDNTKWKDGNYFVWLDSHSRLLKLTLYCDPFQKHGKIYPVDQILLFCFTLWLTWTNLMSLCILHDQAYVCHNWQTYLALEEYFDEIWSSWCIINNTYRRTYDDIHITVKGKKKLLGRKQTSKSNVQEYT